MRVANLAPVLPVPDLAAAVEAFSRLLGAEPRFVDGERWAQFEIDGRRLALAGTDRTSEAAGILVKVDDLAEARRRAQAEGLSPGPTEDGPHETRFTAHGPGGWAILFYCAKP